MIEHGRISYRERLIGHLETALQQLGDTKARGKHLEHLHKIYAELLQARDYAERIDSSAA